MARFSIDIDAQLVSYSGGGGAVPDAMTCSVCADQFGFLCSYPPGSMLAAKTATIPNENSTGVSRGFHTTRTPRGHEHENKTSVKEKSSHCSTRQRTAS